MKILAENEFSETLEMKYLVESNLNLFLEEKNKSESIVKIKIVNKNGFQFKVHNHCGYIRIGDISYFIMPKMGEGFLKTMLQVFNRPFLNIYDNELEQNHISSYFDELIAYLFIGAYDRNLAGKIRKGYIQNIKSTYKMSGKIDLNKSKIFFEYGGQPPTWIMNQWSLNTKYNTAINSLYSTLAGKLKISNQTKSKLSKISLEASEKGYDGNIDYNHLKNGIDRLHEPYRPIFELASYFNLSGDVNGGSSKTYSLLIPTYSLFEQACKILLSQCLPNYVFNIEKSFSIRISDQTNNILKPDIIMKDSNDLTLAVGDCKYSGNESLSLEPNHLYQVNTYMSGYSLSRSFILYPSHEYGFKNCNLNWGKNIYVFKISVNDYKKFKESLEEVANYFTEEDLILNYIK